MSLPIALPAGGMIVREKKPVNLEMPFGSLDSFMSDATRLVFEDRNRALRKTPPLKDSRGEAATI
jgi:hypothetical protein